MPDLRMAASEDAFAELFAQVRESVAESTSGSTDTGPFTVSWDVGFELDDGTVDLQDDGTVEISELDVVYTPLQLTFGIDIEERCVGGFCLIPNPLPFGPSCALRVPEVCIFSADPDISLPLDLSGLVESEISGAFAVEPRHEVDPGRSPSMTDLDAEDAGVPDQWNFYLDPDWIDLDLIDFADTVGNVLEAAIEDAVDALLGPLDGWLVDLILDILGALTDLVREILDIGDDLDEWLSDLLGVSIGLFDWILTVVADFFADRNPVFSLEDPFPILPYDGPLIPVKVPIDTVAITVTDTEAMFTAEIGS